jgi:RimJ/RimL family protein N-acetyltransferase
VPPVRGLRPRYPVRTGRLLLRPWRSDEVDRYREVRGAPEVTRFLYDTPMTRRQAATRLGSLRSTITAEGQWINLAVEVAATGTVAGDVGLGWVSGAHRHAEVGYAFAPDHRGRGYATEAAVAVVEMAFSALGAHRVTGRLDARNTASARLLERLGMRREGHLVENEWVKGEWTDEVVYAVLEDEWAVRRRDRV